MGNSKQKTDAGLRIESVRRGKKIPLTVDGTPIIAHEGESVHAALAASGIQILGTTGRPVKTAVFYAAWGSVTSAGLKLTVFRTSGPA